MDLNNNLIGFEEAFKTLLFYKSYNFIMYTLNYHLNSNYLPEFNERFKELKDIARLYASFDDLFE